LAQPLLSHCEVAKEWRFDERDADTFCAVGITSTGVRWCRSKRNDYSGWPDVSTYDQTTEKLLADGPVLRAPAAVLGEILAALEVQADHLVREIELLEQCAKGERDRVRALLDAGASASAARFGTSALAEALVAGHFEVAMLLLERGADGERPILAKMTPLMFAASHAQGAPLLRVLLARGADPNARDASKHTVLMHAESADAVRSLVEAGADVSALDAHGASALGVATWRANLEVVRALLDAGALPDCSAPCPLVTVLRSRAKPERVLAIVELLLERGADPTPGVVEITYVSRDDLDAAYALLMARARDGEGSRTSLEAAIVFGTTLEALRALADGGSRFDPASPYWRDPKLDKRLATAPAIAAWVREHVPRRP
jgi:ankyrin repeat protein